MKRHSSFFGYGNYRIRERRLLFDKQIEAIIDSMRSYDGFDYRTQSRHLRERSRDQAKAFTKKPFGDTRLMPELGSEERNAALDTLANQQFKEADITNIKHKAARGLMHELMDKYRSDAAVSQIDPAEAFMKGLYFKVEAGNVMVADCDPEKVALALKDVQTEIDQIKAGVLRVKKLKRFQDESDEKSLERQREQDALDKRRNINSVAFRLDRYGQLQVVKEILMSYNSDYQTGRKIEKHLEKDPLVMRRWNDMDPRSVEGKKWKKWKKKYLANYRKYLALAASKDASVLQGTEAELVGLADSMKGMPRFYYMLNQAMDNNPYAVLYYPNKLKFVGGSKDALGDERPFQLKIPFLGIEGYNGAEDFAGGGDIIEIPKTDYQDRIKAFMRRDPLEGLRLVAREYEAVWWKHPESYADVVAVALQLKPDLVSEISPRFITEHEDKYLALLFTKAPMVGRAFLKRVDLRNRSTLGPLQRHMFEVPMKDKKGNPTVGKMRGLPGALSLMHDANRIEAVLAVWTNPSLLYHVRTTFPELYRVLRDEITLLSTESLNELFEKGMIRDEDIINSMINSLQSEFEKGDTRLIDQFPGIIARIPQERYSDPAFCETLMTIMEIKGELFRYAPYSWRANYQIALRIISSNADAFVYASDALRSDPRIIYVAMLAEKKKNDPLPDSSSVEDLPLPGASSKKDDADKDAPTKPAPVRGRPILRVSSKKDDADVDPLATSHRIPGVGGEDTDPVSPTRHLIYGNFHWQDVTEPMKSRIEEKFGPNPPEKKLRNWILGIINIEEVKVPEIMLKDKDRDKPFVVLRFLKSRHNPEALLAIGDTLNTNADFIFDKVLPLGRDYFEYINHAFFIKNHTERYFNYVEKNGLALDRLEDHILYSGIEEGMDADKLIKAADTLIQLIVKGSPRILLRVLRDRENMEEANALMRPEFFIAILAELIKDVTKNTGRILDLLTHTPKDFQEALKEAKNADGKNMIALAAMQSESILKRCAGDVAFVGTVLSLLQDDLSDQKNAYETFDPGPERTKAMTAFRKVQENVLRVLRSVPEKTRKGVLAFKEEDGSTPFYPIVVQLGVLTPDVLRHFSEDADLASQIVAGMDSAAVSSVMDVITPRTMDALMKSDAVRTTIIATVKDDPELLGRISTVRIYEDVLQQHIADGHAEKVLMVFRTAPESMRSHLLSSDAVRTYVLETVVPAHFEILEYLGDELSVFETVLPTFIADPAKVEAILMRAPRTVIQKLLSTKGEYRTQIIEAAKNNKKILLYVGNDVDFCEQVLLHYQSLKPGEQKVYAQEVLSYMPSAVVRSLLQKAVIKKVTVRNGCTIYCRNIRTGKYEWIIKNGYWVEYAAMSDADLTKEYKTLQKDKKTDTETYKRLKYEMIKRRMKTVFQVGKSVYIGVERSDGSFGMERGVLQYGGGRWWVVNRYEGWSVEYAEIPKGRNRRRMVWSLAELSGGTAYDTFKDVIPQSDGADFIRRREKMIRTNAKLTYGDYVSLFGSDIRQTNVGNCYMLSTFISLQYSDNAEALIRSSMKKVGSTYEVSLPLGSVPEKVITVTSKDLQPQVVDGKEYRPVIARKGWQILEAAFTIARNGRDAHGRINRKESEGGEMNEEFADLIDGKSNDVIMEDKTTMLYDEEASKLKAVTLLNNFTNGKDMVTAARDTGADIRMAGHTILGNHAYVVTAVDKVRKVVTIRNPFYPRTAIKMSYTSFLQSFNEIHAIELKYDRMFL